MRAAAAFLDALHQSPGKQWNEEQGLTHGGDGEDRQQGLAGADRRAGILQAQEGYGKTKHPGQVAIIPYHFVQAWCEAENQTEATADAVRSDDPLVLAADRHRRYRRKDQRGGDVDRGGKPL